jgi:glutamate-1-semialdehyde 2,1-aminomutase
VDQRADEVSSSAQLETTTDQELRRRAGAVIPGGMYGHQSVANLPRGYPQFFASAEGPHVTDADGNRYIDLMCSYGPMILGHRHPAVEEAAERQRRQGDCLSAPTARVVELAECLVDTIVDADWAMIAKNGTDATTACLTIARAATGRSIVLAARGSYHGAAPWCSPKPDGVLPSDRAAMRYFQYNDLASLEQAVQNAAGDLAGILITPFKHIEGLDQELVKPDFAAKVRQLCDQHGALLLLDDVRCGLRLNLGGSWEPLGIRVDLSAWSKALGNGYPVAAITGREQYCEAASRVFLTGSFWTASVPMAAVLATIGIMRSEDGVARIASAGRRLRAGIEDQARSYDLDVCYSGHVSMPYITFAADTDYQRMNAFALSSLEGGVYLAPRHNWFLSVAHTDAIVDEALRATDGAFRRVASTFGRG